MVETWLRLELNRSSPGELLAVFPPADEPGTGKDPLADPPLATFAEDVRWLLERLTARDVLRINAGGPAFVDDSGAWSCDRFAVAGLTKPWPRYNFVPYFGELHGGEGRDALFRRQRWFLEKSSRTSYRIPLPSGRYRVTLSFAELVRSRPEQHVFDVTLEGEAKIESFDLARDVGYATAVEKEFDIDVDDTTLDIGIVPRKGRPSLAGIEIERRP